MLRASVLASVLVLSACGPGAAPSTSAPDAGPALHAGVTARPEGAVRIVTFNVARFFDTVCDSGSCGGGSFEEQPSQTMFDARADQVADGLKDLDASVFLLEEIEDQKALDGLIARVGAEFPVSYMAETGAPASMDVAVLAKGEFVSAKSHRDTVLHRPDGTTTYFSRDFPEIHLKIDGHPVIVFPAHFRSKVNDDAGRRLAEAQAAHDLVVQVAAANPTNLVVMGGDLNDTPDSAPLQALTDDGRLLRVAADLPEADQCTRPFQGVPLALDHLLLETEANGAYVPKSAHVVHDLPANGFAGSDHAALLADFRPTR
jgi:endonuclease/exonuclease/phosphatase family metal-dependent hydrolase